MDGGARKAAVHGVAEGRTRLSDFTFTFTFSNSGKMGSSQPPATDLLVQPSRHGTQFQRW